MEMKTQKFSFLLLPGFTLLSYVSAIEVLRQVNRVADDELVSWEVITLDGCPVEASNGMRIPADRGLSDSGFTNWLCVCSGFHPSHWIHPGLIQYLSRLDRFGATVGGCCSGSYILARAGLLSNMTATIHWEHLDSLREEFPELAVTMDLFTMSSRRFTCAGGAAMLDLMLEITGRRFGLGLREEVRCQLLINRSQEDRQFYQRSAMAGRSMAIHPYMVAALELIENNIEEPLTRDELAEACGLSIRHMERLFRRAFNMGPAAYYLQVRLKKARYLLHHTPMRVAEVAMACGFTSASHFSKKFRDQFGVTPNAMREQNYYSGASKDGEAA